MEMTKYKLGDIATIYDGPHATPKRTDNGPVYLGIDAITEDCKINPNEFTFLSEEDYKIWTKRVVPQFKDIVFSYEATLGRYAIIPENFYGCLGRRLGIIRVKSDAVDYKWLYYFFQSPQWKCYIKNHIIKGSTVNRISVDEMPGYEIPACGIADQKKIASVLSALDDKIALNKKMNQKLEAMAKRLYDYWFVQYDFPDKNGHPYKTTGGPMTYNPTLKREIPEGWKVRKLEDVLSKLSSGKRPKGGIDKSLKDGIPSLGAECIDDLGVFDFKKTPYLPHDFKLQVTTGIIEDKDIAVYKDGAYVGKTTMFQDDFPFKFSTVNEHVFLLHCQDESFEEYLLFILKQPEYFSIMQNLGKAKAAQPGLNQEDLMNILILWPSNSVMNAFSKSVKTLFSQLFSNAKENKKLTALRDKLLPLLMNGQVVID